MSKVSLQHKALSAPSFGRYWKQPILSPISKYSDKACRIAYWHTRISKLRQYWISFIHITISVRILDDSVTKILFWMDSPDCRKFLLEDWGESFLRHTAIFPISMLRLWNYFGKELKIDFLGQCTYRFHALRENFHTLFEKNANNRFCAEFVLHLISNIVSIELLLDVQ